MLYNFGKEIGNTDTDGQISFCNVNKKLISMMLENAKDEKNKKSKLYFMLGSSFGLCVTIMLLWMLAFKFKRMEGRHKAFKLVWKLKAVNAKKWI